jgi:hypothetical protein
VEAKQGAPLLIGEGIETCLSAMEASGLPAWAAISRIGIENFNPPPYVDDVIALVDIDASGDGEGSCRKGAERLADEGVRTRLAFPGDRNGGGGRDFNDLLRSEGGADKVRDAINNAQTALVAIPVVPSIAPETTDNPFALIPLDEIAIEDDPPYLIEGLLPLGPALHVFFRPPKSLKSFILMWAYLHVAAGLEYMGRKVQQGMVVYVTNEGVRGVKRRLVAMRRELGIEGKDVPFFLVPVMPNLGAGPDDAIKLIEQIKKSIPAGVPVQAIAIDTLRRAIPGKDESSPKDMSVFLKNFELISEAFACLTSAVHHSPRSDDGRSSGSNALDGGADCMWGSVRGDGDLATVTVHRMKDGREGEEWASSLKEVAVGVDKNGKEITSCVIELADTEVVRVIVDKRKRRRKLRGHAADALECLHEALAEVGDMQVSNRIPANTRSVSIETWKQYWDAQSISNPDKSDIKQDSLDKAFERAGQTLKRGRFIGVWRGRVYAGQVGQVRTS